MDESAETEPRWRVQGALRRAVLGAVVGAGVVTLGLLAGQASATAAENDSPGVSTLASALTEAGHVIDEAGSATDALDNASLDSAAARIARDVAGASRALEKTVAEIASPPAPAASAPPASAPPAPAPPAPAPPAPAHHDPVVPETIASTPASAVDTVATANTEVGATAAATAQSMVSIARASASQINTQALTPAVGIIVDVAAPATAALGGSEVLPALEHSVGVLPDTAIDLLEHVVLGPSPLPVPGLLPLPGVLPLPGLLPPSGPVDPVNGTGPAAAGPASGSPHGPAPLGATRHPGDTAGAAARGEAPPFGVARAGNGGEEPRASGQVGVVFASAGDLPLGDPTLPDSPLAALLNASSSAAPGSSGGPGSPALLPAGLLPRPGWGLDVSHLADTSWCGGITLEPGSTPD